MEEKRLVVELDWFKPAIKLIQQWHNNESLKPEGAYRDDGITPYHTHPIAVADKVRSWGFEQVTPLAALIHDIFEDTAVSTIVAYKALSEHYMKSQVMVALSIVDFITNINWDNVPGDHPPRKTRKGVENERHARCLDPRALVVKAADRIHNLSTLDAKKDPSWCRKYTIECKRSLELILLRLCELDLLYKDTIGVYTVPPKHVAACVSEITEVLATL